MKTYAKQHSGLINGKKRNLPYLTNKIESVQYNAVSAIAGAIRGTSIEKLYQDLGFESLKDKS